MQIFIILIILIPLLIWIYYPLLQSSLFQQLDLPADLALSVSNVDFLHDDKTITLKIGKAEIGNKKEVLTLLHNIRLILNKEKIFSGNLSVVRLDIERIFLNIDQVQKLSFDSKSTYRQILLRWVPNIKAQNVLLKYRDNILPTISLSYDNETVHLAPFHYKPDYQGFTGQLPEVVIQGDFLLDILGDKLGFVGSISNQELSLEVSYDVDHEIQTLWVKTDEMKLDVVKRYLPTELLGVKLSNWIDRSLSNGTMKNIVFKLSERFIHKKVKLNFLANFEQYHIKFHPDWPALTHASGQVRSDGDKINITKLNTQIASLSIKHAKVSIIDILAAESAISADISLEDESQKMLDFLATTPLRESLLGLDLLHLDGRSSSDIYLLLPLKADINLADTFISVENKFENNLLYYASELGQGFVKNISANLHFQDQVFSLKGKGDFREMPLDFFIKNHKQDTNIKLNYHGVDIKANSLTTDVYEPPKWQLNLAKNNNTIDAIVSPDFDKNVFDIIVNEANLNTKNSPSNDEWLLSIEDIPKIYLSTKKVTINGYLLPKSQLVLTQKDEQVKLSGKFKIRPDFPIYVSGNWQYNHNTQNDKTSLFFKAKDKKIASLLNLISNDKTTTDGKFKANVDLSCDCAPWQIRLKKLTGEAKINIEKGRLRNQEAGLGRLLSLLSIKALKKRLSLDGSDVVGRGYEFNSIDATASIKLGRINIHRFNVNSLSSQIDLSGKVILTQKQLDLIAKVTPSISDSLPIAAYLANGSLAGLGVWLLDKALFEGELLNKLINSTVAFDYTIKGDWKNPEIK